MNCINEDHMQRYLDNECSQADREVIGQHIGQCQRCSSSFTEYSERLSKIKTLFELLNTKQSEIPEFRIPEPNRKLRNIILRYLLPMAAAAGLLLLLLLRPFHKTQELPSSGHYIQNYISGELDANKPVSEYPLVVTVIAADGSILQTRIN